jgi:hypothetical protein
MALKSVQDLCNDWLQAKKDEASANKRRVEIEALIVEQTGKRDEGSQTHDLGEFKVTVTGKVTRKMDWKAWETVKGKIAPALHPVKLKPELDEKGVKWLHDNEPEIYALLPIEVKPAKTAVEVKVVDSE